MRRFEWGPESAVVLISAMAIIACENAIEPPSPAPGEIWRSVASAGAVSYVATLLPDGDLGSVDDAFLVIDESGVVFGTTHTGRAASWTVDASGGVTGPLLLGALPAPFDDAGQWVRSTPSGGYVVGYAQNERSGPTVPWLWVNGSMRLLPQSEGATRSWPLATNDGGAVVGQVRFGSEGDYGAVWLPPYDTEPVLLPRMEEYILNSARGITEAGLILGLVRSDSDALVHWQIDPDGTVLGGPDQLAGSDDLLLSGANRDLDGVGVYHGAQPVEASLYRSGSTRRIDLGMLDGHVQSRARGVTARTPAGALQVVGQSSPSDDDYDSRGVVWTVDAMGNVAGPYDIGLPDAYPRKRPSDQFVSAHALSVNSQGWIVGFSRRADGTFFATIWQPTDAGEPPAGTGPIASFAYGCGNSPTCQFADTSTPEGSAISGWQWTFGDGRTASTPDPEITFSQAGNHTVTLTVTDGNGLSDAASAAVKCSVHPRHGLRCS
jgi:hypothetical protein